MTRAWEFIKDHVGYVYALMFVVFAVIDIVDVGWTWWLLFDAAMAALFLFLYQCPRSPFARGKKVSVSVELDLRKNPVPYEGPPQWLADHRKEIPNCSLCKQWGWDKL